eukprot:scaffold162917_cov18-Tisochrysis_lutea.AAC.1
MKKHCMHLPVPTAHQCHWEGHRRHRHQVIHSQRHGPVHQAIDLHEQHKEHTNAVDQVTDDIATSSSVKSFKALSYMPLNCTFTEGTLATLPTFLSFGKPQTVLPIRTSKVIFK